MKRSYWFAVVGAVVFAAGYLVAQPWQAARALPEAIVGGDKKDASSPAPKATGPDVTRVPDQPTQPIAAGVEQESQISGSIGETPMLDADLEYEREKISIAARAVEAMQKRDERERLAGKSFNESRISWSFACDQSVDGISLLGTDRLSKLTYDEKTNVCSCVAEAVPYNIEMILDSRSRSLDELGSEARSTQLNAFDQCYAHAIQIKEQRAAAEENQRQNELQELKDRQESNANAGQG